VAAHTAVAGDLVGVNHEQLRFFREQLFLHNARQVLPDFIFAERAVEQERPARH
jgi:hypothetical protein